MSDLIMDYNTELSIKRPSVSNFNPGDPFESNRVTNSSPDSQFEVSYDENLGGQQGAQGGGQQNAGGGAEDTQTGNGRVLVLCRILSVVCSNV